MQREMESGSRFWKTPTTRRSDVQLATMLPRPVPGGAGRLASTRAAMVGAAMAEGGGTPMTLPRARRRPASGSGRRPAASAMVLKALTEEREPLVALAWMMRGLAYGGVLRPAAATAAVGGCGPPGLPSLARQEMAPGNTGLLALAKAATLAAAGAGGCESLVSAPRD